jgi:hypothetical protein
MTGLFEIRENNRTCKECKHIQKWISQETGKTFYYCGARYSGRTNNKLLKTKLKNSSCGLFEANKNDN